MLKRSSPPTFLIISALLFVPYSQPIQAQDTPSVTQKATETEQSTDDFKTLMDRFSYAYGADLAEKFKDEGITLNVDLLAEAMQAAFSDGDMKMPADEVIATLDLYKQIHTKKKETEWKALSEKNKQEGEAFLKENAKKKDVVVTESGLQYKVLTKGDGKYSPKAHDEVTVHYRGTFVDGTEFDSTYKRDEAYQAKVKQLIQGWSEALQLMSKGAQWQLFIPADIAYGEQGSGQYVGPNSVLIFDVKLLDINKQKKT